MNQERNGTKTEQPYNLNQIKAFADGSGEELKALLYSLVRSGKQSLSLFSKNLVEKNEDMLCELAHKMSTTFKYLEADEIVDLLTQIENKDFLPEDLSQFLRACKEAQDKMQGLFERLETKENLYNS